jgi:hypothetical protein
MSGAIRTSAINNRLFLPALGQELACTSSAFSSPRSFLTRAVQVFQCLTMLGWTLSGRASLRPLQPHQLVPVNYITIPRVSYAKEQQEEERRHHIQFLKASCQYAIIIHPHLLSLYRPLNCLLAWLSMLANCLLRHILDQTCHAFSLRPSQASQTALSSFFEAIPLRFSFSVPSTVTSLTKNRPLSPKPPPHS